MENINKGKRSERGAIMKYVYPAIIENAGDGYNVCFPDIPGCYTCGEDLPEAIAMAADALALFLYELEAGEEAIPSPSEIKHLACGQDEIATLVYCDTLEYQKMYNKAAVKKTLSIPGWLNYMAEKASVNFSQVLQDALKEKLDSGYIKP